MLYFYCLYFAALSISRDAAFFWINEMPRLTEQQWQDIKIAHEINKVSFSELAEQYNVNKSNISRKARKEGWNQEQKQQLITASVENKKENLKIRNETQQLNATEQQAVADAVQHELEMIGIYQHFDKKIMTKAMHHIDLIEDGDDFAVSKLVQLSNVRKNISPKSVEASPGNQTQVNIQNNNTESSSGINYDTIELIDVS